MKIFRSILSWVYEKNYEFDHLPPMKRDMVFFSAIFTMMILSGFIPALLMVIGKGNYSSLSFLMLLICVGGAAAFRMPYMHGSLNKYMPEHIRLAKATETWKRKQQERAQQQNYEKTAQKIMDDWRLPYLKVLGLGMSANTEEIKAAYRKQAMIWHPDRNKSPNAEETFKMIKNAYEKLT